MQIRKTRDTWSNRQHLPWSTKQSWSKVNRVLPKEQTAQSKHSFPETQEKSLHMREQPTGCFQIRKGLCQICILSPCLFNFYAVYNIHIVRLDEAQDWINTGGRNISKLRKVDGITFMRESEEERKSLLIKIKEEKANFGLKLNIQRTKIMKSDPITA